MMTRLLLSITALVILTACGPRLEQVTDYIPPTSQQGLACIQEAQVARQACQADNERRVNACFDDARQESYRQLALQEEQYTLDLEAYIDLQGEYEAARNGYNEQQRLILRDGELAYVRCSNDVNLAQVANFPQCKRHLDEAQKRAEQLLPPIAPIRPIRPTQEAIFNDLSRNCPQQTTNCTIGFDEAYISCGGRIERNTICVANCN